MIKYSAVEKNKQQKKQIAVNKKTNDKNITNKNIEKIINNTQIK